MDDVSNLLLNIQWDIVFPQPDSALLINSYRDHYWIRQASPNTLAVLKLLQDGLSSSDALRKVERESLCDLVRERRLFQKLYNIGILIPSSIDERQMLSAEQQERYSTLGAWLATRSKSSDPATAIRRLQRSKVAIVGAGGVGSICALNLACSAVGAITIIDGDIVELSNLVRQPLYRESDARNKISKASALSRSIRAHTNSCSVRVVKRFIRSEEDALRLLIGHDFVLNTADTPRVVVNRWVSDACLKHKMAAIHVFLDQFGPLYLPGQTACFRCLEARWRKESGGDHDEIVAALSGLRPRRQPSMISGPSEMAALVCRDIVDYLAEAGTPQSSTGLIRIEEMRRHVYRIPRNPRCVCAEPAGIAEK